MASTIGVLGCSSRTRARSSLPPCALSNTSARTPCGSRLFTTSRNSASCVLGIMLMVKRRSSCVVFTPNGTAGNAATRTPCAAHAAATRAATSRPMMVSVPYGKCVLCGSVAPNGSSATGHSPSRMAGHVCSSSRPSRGAYALGSLIHQRLCRRYHNQPLPAASLNSPEHPPGPCAATPASRQGAPDRT